MKRVIWVPLLLGGVLGLLDFLSLAVDFLIPLGPYGATGPQEILITMSAALGGPLGLATTMILQELGGYLFFLRDLLPPDQWTSTAVLFAGADFIAHIIAGLIVAYSFRFLYQRVRQLYIFIAAWVLLVAIYYALLVFLQSILIGKVVSGLSPLDALYQDNLPEFFVVVVITTMIMVALPARYRKPLWYDEIRELHTANEEISTTEPLP